MKGKKKYILIGVLVLVLIVAGYLNYALGKGGETPSDQAKARISGESGLKTGELELPVMSTGEYLADDKQNRENVRQKEITYIDAIIDDNKSDQETLKDAQQQKMDIVRSMEKELTIEGLLNAKGFDDTIVTVHSGAVNVVVKLKEITEQQAAQILDIVQKETDEPAKNIKIILQG